MLAVVRLTAGLSLWAAALWGTLQVAQLPGDWGHEICGPWGCGPPIQALLACHGFWIVLLGPSTVIASLRMSPRSLIRLGKGILLIGITAMTAIVVVQAVTWLPKAYEFQKPYFIQRCLFVLATLVDVPIVPLTLAGTASWIVGAARRSHAASDTIAPHDLSVSGLSLAGHQPSVTVGPSSASTPGSVASIRPDGIRP